MKNWLTTAFKDAATLLQKHWWAALVGILVSAGAGWLFFSAVVFEKLTFLSYDLPFQFRHHIVPNEAVMIYMDESSYSELKQSYTQPWDRGLHAELVHRMTREGARSVMFDIVFSDPGPDKQADQDFAQEIKENGRVILAADNIPSDTGINGASMSSLVLPYDLFATNAAAIGTAEMFTDPDVMNRRHLPEKLDESYFCLSWVTAATVGAPSTRDPKIHASERWYNYYGRPKTIPCFSYYQLFNPGEIPDGTFSNKMVFVGANIFTRGAFERKDAYPSPFPVRENESKFMPGVEIQATGALNLVRGDWLRRLPREQEKALIIFSGIILGLGLLVCRPMVAVGLSVFAAITVALLNFYFFANHRYWFPWLIVEAQIPFALAWSVAFNSIQLYVQKRLLEQSLGKYLSPKRVKQLINRKAFLDPGAEKQMLTICFTDLENFTSLSEDIDSDHLAKVMNNYFEKAVTDIFTTDGTVVKYIGDAIFAFWNAPEDQNDHALRACKAALLLSKQHVTFSKRENTMTYCRTRIGLHTGVASVGNFGSATRIDYTAIGENINLASRMEGLNKHLGTNVLITGDTRAAIGDQLVVRSCGKLRLKGFERSVEVYELIGLPETAEKTKAWRDAFEEGVRLFQKGEFDAAEKSFKCVLEIKHHDGPSKYYIREIEEFRVKPPNVFWEGELELKEK